MGSYLKYALLLVVLPDLSSGTQQHLVCTTIQDVFEESRVSQTSSGARRLQGPPGKAGPRGRPGRPGLRASVDYDRLNDIITEKVASALEETDSRITLLERKVATMTSSSSSSVHGCQGGLTYRGKCYTIPHISSSADMDYTEAVTECAKTGALIAEIHDRTQQQALQDFSNSKMPPGLKFVYLYIGMEYQSETSTLLLRSGRRIRATALQWDSGFPSTSASRKYMIFEVGNDGDSSVGVWNTGRNRNSYGVICEKSA